MASFEKEDFSSSGPVHLTVVDWKNPNHRRSVAASLVQGVYVLEKDRQQNREGLQSLASHWWDFFHFRLLEPLFDDVDSSIFGAIYELELRSPNESGAPRFVIAFRGTINKGSSFSRDLDLDFRFLQNVLHRTTRSEIAVRAVEGTVDFFGEKNVWLAGHSLGSALAMVAGKQMARRGMPLEAFLFNPPFFSAPMERIRDRKVRRGIRIAGDFITAGLALAAKGKNIDCEEEAFARLARWVPWLFVNMRDPICSEYVGYFEHRKEMERMGLGGVGRIATRNSMGGLLMGGREKEALHLVPSAKVAVNLKGGGDFRGAHGIHQWWRSDLELRTTVYEYRF